MAEPAYTRLQNDERRRRLLELGERLFTEHSYGELSMARIAREAGISKALLYHYFPSKRDYFVATLASGAEEIRRRVEPDPDLPPAQALMGSLDAYLAWIEEHADGYAKLVEGAASEPDVREIVDRVRDETADRILAGLNAHTPAASGPPGPPRPPPPPPPPRAPPSAAGCGSSTASATSGSRSARSTAGRSSG